MPSGDQVPLLKKIDNALDKAMVSLEAKVNPHLSGKIEKKGDDKDGSKKEEEKKEDKGNNDLKNSVHSNGSAKNRSSDPAEGIMPVVAPENREKP